MRMLVASLFLILIWSYSTAQIQLPICDSTILIKKKNLYQDWNFRKVKVVIYKDSNLTISCDEAYFFDFASYALKRLISKDSINSINIDSIIKSDGRGYYYFFYENFDLHNLDMLFRLKKCNIYYNHRRIRKVSVKIYKNRDCTYRGEYYVKSKLMYTSIFMN